MEKLLIIGGPVLFALIVIGIKMYNRFVASEHDDKVTRERMESYVARRKKFDSPS